MAAIAVHDHAFGRRTACAMLLLAFAVLMAPATSRAQVGGEAQSNDRSVMAAYIYRFITYVEWPMSAFSSADAPIVIGVLNADDIAAELEQVVKERTAQSRRLQVRRVTAGETWSGINVLFIGEGAPKILQSAKTLAERSVLTITGVERGIDYGSVINFVQIDGRVRFEVNVAAAEKSGLRLSSRLLTVATRVKAS